MIDRFLSFLFCSLILVGLGISPVGAREKHALIIANQDYENGTDLQNPIRDGERLNATLEKIGFKTQVIQNATFSEMRQAISDFGFKHRETDNILLVYYSGHGAEFKGENYLIPTDAKLQNVSAARHEAIRLADIQSFLYREVSDEQKAKGVFNRGLNLIILDACRDNPYREKEGDKTAGLGKTDGGYGDLIWYATQPDDVAEDGVNANNSPFVRGIVEAIELADQEQIVEETFKVAAQLTAEYTGGEQIPWQAGTIVGTYRFKGLNEAQVKSRWKFDVANFDKFLMQKGQEEYGLQVTRIDVANSKRRIGDWRVGEVIFFDYLTGERFQIHRGGSSKPVPAVWQSNKIDGPLSYASLEYVDNIFELNFYFRNGFDPGKEPPQILFDGLDRTPNFMAPQCIENTKICKLTIFFKKNEPLYKLANNSRTLSVQRRTGENLGIISLAGSARSLSFLFEFEPEKGAPSSLDTKEWVKFIKSTEYSLCDVVWRPMKYPAEYGAGEFARVNFRQDIGPNVAKLALEGSPNCSAIYAQSGNPAASRLELESSGFGKDLYLSVLWHGAMEFGLSENAYILLRYYNDLFDKALREGSYKDISGRQKQIIDSIQIARLLFGFCPEESFCEYTLKKELKRAENSEMEISMYAPLAVPYLNSLMKRAKSREELEALSALFKRLYKIAQKGTFQKISDYATEHILLLDKKLEN